MTESGPASAEGRRYLRVLILGVSAALGLGWAFGTVGHDHFAAIPLKGDPTWLQNSNALTIREIQDEDVYYHNIGSSIGNARAADIIFLGNSVLLFGLEDEMLKAFGLGHGLRLFNMALAGVPSGEFLRQIVKRWNIRPKLWIISADDHGAKFFSPVIQDNGNFSHGAAEVVGYSRLRGWLNVAARNLKWRAQGFVPTHLPRTFVKMLFPRYPTPRLWRNVERGSVSYDEVPAYVRTDNPLITVIRDQNCHTDPAEISTAQAYVKDIGGSVILMLTPHNAYCPTRVRELAQALDVETIIPPNTDYTSTDGTHLDRRGALAFTAFFLSSLEKTAAFRTLVGQNSPTPP